MGVLRLMYGLKHTYCILFHGPDHGPRGRAATFINKYYAISLKYSKPDEDRHERRTTNIFNAPKFIFIE